MYVYLHIGCKDVITGANIFGLYISHIWDIIFYGLCPSYKRIFRYLIKRRSGWIMTVPQATRDWRAQMTTLSCSLHVPLCHSSSGIVRQGFQCEGTGVGGSVYSPPHSRHVVHERASLKNSSCSALWQDPPDCSLHKEPQLPEHHWLKERAREQTARVLSSPPTHPLPLCLLCPNRPKICIPHINPRMGSVHGDGYV